MKRSTKKGFTIVELVIVIAIIAILAAVLIPTFASLIQKANTSADIQAVREMNTFLAINEVEEPKTINEVFKALENGGMTVKDYHPLVSGRFFFWDSKLNRVLYTDADYNVIFPEDYKTADRESNGWLSLSGEIKEDKNYETSTDGKTVTIGSAEQYYAFAKANKNNLPAGITVQFNVPTIDLMGADVGFQISAKGDYNIIGYGENGTTIKGLSQLKNNYIGTVEQGDNVGKNYASGLIQVIDTKNGTESNTVTIKDITISGGTFGDLETGGVAAVVGKVMSKQTVTVEFNNVKVIDTVINGKNKVGVLVGQVMGDTNIKVTGCKIENVTVNCSEGEAGKVIGCLTTKKVATFDRPFDVWVNATLNLVEGKFDRKVVKLSGETKVTVTNMERENNKYVIPTSGATTEEVTTTATAVVEKLDKDGKVEGYRLFFEKAYVTAIYDGNNATIHIGEESEKPINLIKSEYSHNYWGATKVESEKVKCDKGFVFTTAYCGD